VFVGQEFHCCEPLTWILETNTVTNICLIVYITLASEDNESKDSIIDINMATATLK
jgi:hypothetical protein